MSSSVFNLAIPQSILDTDLYKLTMQQAVLHHYPDVHATYRFTNRNSNTFFTRKCIEQFRTAVSHFTGLTLTELELQWLKNTCPYMTPKYLSYLAAYRYQPEQVKVKYIPVTTDNLIGSIEIEISGPWVEAILWEVPLMACLSESFFQSVDIDWNYEHQDGIAYTKAKALIEAGCVFSEFGTRRRRSFETQDIVVRALKRASEEKLGSGKLSGTSNVYLAYRYNLMPIGTIAHEWFMGVAALKGYEHANLTALKLWEEVYDNHRTPLISLTDTFTTASFVKDFMSDAELAHRWTGVRQDSGDPLMFARRMQEMYQTMGIPHEKKSLIFSDALTVNKCLEIKTLCDELKFNNASFGIGTFLTNDFKALSTGLKSKPLNMVIKLSSVNNRPCVKMSDDLTKTTGDKQTVDFVKATYGIL